MYVQNKGNILLLSVCAIQRNHHGLLCEAFLLLVEEMCLHLVVENCKNGGIQAVRDRPISLT